MGVEWTTLFIKTYLPFGIFAYLLQRQIECKLNAEHCTAQRRCSLICFAEIILPQRLPTFLVSNWMFGDDRHQPWHYKRLCAETLWRVLNLWSAERMHSIGRWLNQFRIIFASIGLTGHGLGQKDECVERLLRFIYDHNFANHFMADGWRVQTFAIRHETRNNLLPRIILK